MPSTRPVRPSTALARQPPSRTATPAVAAAAAAVPGSHPPALPFAADGVYTGEFTTVALCGFIRGQGEADGALDRLWVKHYQDAKRGGHDI